MATRGAKAPATDSVPQMPQTSPSNFGQPNHDFTLQAVMELQKSMGEMNSTLKTLSSTIDGVKGKVDDLVGWKHKILGGAAALLFAGSVLGFLIAKFSDLFVLKSSASTAQVATVPPSQVEPVKR